MNLALLLLRPSGQPIDATTRARYSRAQCCVGRDLRWYGTSSVAVLLGSDRPSLGPSVAVLGTYVAIGAVRLDNRSEVGRWGSLLGGASGDLELVLRMIACHGERHIPELLGDFAFAIYDTAARRLFAARDAFGVKRLYYTEQNDLIAFASRAELLANAGQYDLQSLTELAAVCVPSLHRSVYADVRPLPPGHLASLRHNRVTATQFWSAEHFVSAPLRADQQREQYEIFRSLFAEAVRSRLSSAPDTWSQLSGGLDSSSVVSMAQQLAAAGAAPHGVAGTISWVYRWSTDSDERRYSNAVVQHYGIRNEVLRDDWLWEDDGFAPPLTDEPDPEFPFYARERRTCRLIRGAGGRVLLTGFGSDHYLLGNMFFFADWVASGRVRDAVREMFRRAVLARVSFWNLAYQNAVLPLVPRWLQAQLVPGWARPSWIADDAAKAFGLNDSVAEVRVYSGRRGRKYSDLVIEQMRSIPFTLSRHFIAEEELDLRHPFLYRPLVEFGLQLPSEMCVQPNARKWILREAMRGILPEAVRTRVGKGANRGCMLQSIIHEQRKIDRLLADPILAQLGCIQPSKLRAAYSRACLTGDEELLSGVVYTLALETWLQVRSGRWPAGEGKSGSNGNAS